MLNLKQIVLSVALKHWHTNIDKLHKIDENSGNLTYNGNRMAKYSELPNQARVTAANNSAGLTIIYTSNSALAFDATIHIKDVTNGGAIAVKFLACRDGNTISDTMYETTEIGDASGILDVYADVYNGAFRIIISTSCVMSYVGFVNAV